VPTKTLGPPLIRPFENFYEAMAHPLRRKALLILYSREASPKEIADELNEDTSLTSHHVKRLAELGYAELVRKEPVRGSTIVRHIYKALDAVDLDVEEWNALAAEDPAFARHQVCGTMQAQIDDFCAAVIAGRLGEDARWHMSRNPAVVDEQGLDETLDLMRGVQEQLYEIVARSAARRSDSGEDAVRICASLNVFKAAPR